MMLWTAVPGRGRLTGSRARARKPGSASLRAGLAILGVLLACAFLAYALFPYPQTDLAVASLPPLSGAHVLGTDTLGRDVFLWSARSVVTSLTVAFLVVLMSAAVGVTVGIVAGYSGGWVDALLMRLVDLKLAVPSILIFLSAAVLLDRNIVTMTLLLGSVSWVAYARLVRTQVLVERERGYIAAARLAGTTRTGIAFGHLLPSAATPILVFASLQMGFVMLAEGSLSFLGLGLEPPITSLGWMIAQGRGELTGPWWIATVPGVFILLLIISCNLIGDGLRDRFHVDEGS